MMRNRNLLQWVFWAVLALAVFAAANLYGTRDARSVEQQHIPVVHSVDSNRWSQVSMAREVARQDWAHHLQSKQRRTACDLRGPNGGTFAGYRKAIRYVIAHSPRTGRAGNPDYRRGVALILGAC